MPPIARFWLWRETDRDDQMQAVIIPAGRSPATLGNWGHSGLHPMPQTVVWGNGETSNCVVHKRAALMHSNRRHGGLNLLHCAPAALEHVRVRLNQY